MVARDGIEPPTPAFSGPLVELTKWFEIDACCRMPGGWRCKNLGRCRITSARSGARMFAYCSHAEAPGTKQAEKNRSNLGQMSFSTSCERFQWAWMFYAL